jgi:hypothetical protein
MQDPGELQLRHLRNFGLYRLKELHFLKPKNSDLKKSCRRKSGKGLLDCIESSICGKKLRVYNPMSMGMGGLSEEDPSSLLPVQASLPAYSMKIHIKGEFD